MTKNSILSKVETNRTEITAIRLTKLELERMLDICKDRNVTKTAYLREILIDSFHFG
jgi:hypothetical protein